MQRVPSAVCALATTAKGCSSGSHASHHMRRLNRSGGSCAVVSSPALLSQDNSGSIMANSTALVSSARSIIVPRQLKAYGDTFSRSIGERSDNIAGHLVLQSLSPSRTQSSPLLARPVKTKTIDSFEEMMLAPELRSALAEMQITTPSPIQQTAIEAILQRKNTLVAAPHGDGKTLAYLLPLYQNMMKDRDVYKISLRERRPRMLLLAPTREVIDQLQGICDKLEKATGIKAVSFSSRKRAKYHLSRLLKDTMPDVIIMDPKVLLRLIRVRRLFLDDLRYVAVDEADAMMSSLHDHDAVHLLMKVRKREMYKYLWPVQTQFVFSSPYMTRKLEYLVGKRFPDTVTCMFRKDMHRPPPSLQHRFLAVRAESEKFTLLQHLLKKHHNKPMPVETDEAEVAVHAEPRKLSGSLEDWRRRHGEQQQQQGRSLYKGTGEASDQYERGMLDDALVPGSSMEDQGHHRRLRQQQQEEDDEKKTPSTTLSASSRHSSGNDYTQDPHARVELERLRPLHWHHLSTIAAPFTCHVPRTIFGEGQRVMVFMRNIDSATAIFHQLRAAGYATTLLHASLPWKVRRDMFEDFASGRTNILCCTDLAARGLDLHVDVVINFDMPNNALTYLSRAGRTARMGRQGRVYSLYGKQQGVIVSAVRAFLKKGIPLEGVSNHKQHMMQPRYAEWRTHKINALARSYVSLITTKTIPAHLERTYIHHNATWRPIFRPQGTGMHGGVPVRQQDKIMDRVMSQAVWYRREQLGRRKGGRAKFGRRDQGAGVWNDVGGIASREVAGMAQSPNPGGESFGPPLGPPS